MLRSLVFCAAFCTAAAARADMKAVYSGPDGSPLIAVELDDSGAVRFGGAKSYSLFTKSGDYSIWEEDGVVKVARFSDFKAVLDAQNEAALAALGPAPEPVETAPAAPPEAAKLAATGKASVNGRTGTAYALPDWPPEQAIVVAEDKSLAPLGRAWAKSLTVQQDGLESVLAAVAELLGRAGPLRINGHSLESVKSEPIPDARFELPAKPMTRAEVAEMIAKEEGSGH